MDSFRNDLKWAMQKTLIENIKDNGILYEADERVQVDYIKNQVTYEQLLNLCFIPKQEIYHEAESIENVVNVVFENAFQSELSSYSHTDMYNSVLESAVHMEDEIEDLAKEYESLKPKITNNRNKSSFASQKQLDKYSAKMRKKNKLDLEASVQKAQNASDKRTNLQNQMSNSKTNYIDQIIGGTKEFFGATKDKMDDMLGSTGGIMVLAGMGAVALGVAGNYLYKKHWSKAARACKNSKDKNTCVYKYKKTAIAKTIADLKAAKSKCSKQKYPDRCSAKLDTQISKWKAKLA